MKSRVVCLVVVLSFVLTGCSKAESDPAGLRRFSIGDASLVGANADRAAYITSLNHTWVATKDIIKPACSGRDRFIVVADTPGVGRWSGGNPGCQVVEMALPDGLVEFAFNPYCQLAPNHVNGNCLKLPSQNAPAAAMRSRLRPAKWQEVIALLNRHYMPEDGELQIPASIANWYVVEGSRPFAMAPLFHGEALNIIVPKGVKLNGGQLGRNRLYLGQEGPYGDPLCQAVQLHGVNALPLKFSGAELEYLKDCEH